MPSNSRSADPFPMPFWPATLPAAWRTPDSWMAGNPWLKAGPWTMLDPWLKADPWTMLDPWLKANPWLAGTPWPTGHAAAGRTDPLQAWMSASAQMMGIFLHSAQTIALRFALAPAWMGHHAWVRQEWHDMTAEKTQAAIDAMTGAALAAMWPWNARSVERVMHAALAPYDSKTRENASRLGGEALRRAMTGRIGSAAPRTRRTSVSASRRRPAA